MKSSDSEAFSSEVTTPQLVVFDFCDTLVDFQSADPFLLFSLERLGRPVGAIRLGILRGLERLRLLGAGFTKRWLISRLAGANLIEVEYMAAEYVEKIIMKRLREPLIERLKGHAAKGDYLVLLSGGFEIYLRYFGTRFNFHRVIGNDLEVRDEKLTGRIVGKDCLGEEKVQRLRQMINLESHDLKRAVVYSDSVSDLPLFRLVGHRVAIIRGPTVPAWTRNLKCEVIHV